MLRGVVKFTSPVTTSGTGGSHVLTNVVGPVETISHPSHPVADLLTVKLAVLETQPGAETVHPYVELLETEVTAETGSRSFTMVPDEADNALQLPVPFTGTLAVK